MNKIYSKNPDVVFRKIADEFVLVPIRQKAVDLKSIYTLNDTAAFIWELIDGVRTVSDIRDKVVENFEIDPSGAAADAGTVLSQLEVLSFIREA